MGLKFYLLHLFITDSAFHTYACGENLFIVFIFGMKTNVQKIHFYSPRCMSSEIHSKQHSFYSYMACECKFHFLKRKHWDIDQWSPSFLFSYDHYSEERSIKKIELWPMVSAVSWERCS